MASECRTEVGSSESHKGKDSLHKYLTLLILTLKLGTYFRFTFYGRPPPISRF
jgi:hypothetical protein